MIPEARVQASVELLEEIISKKQPISSTISPYFRSRRFIGSKDRRAVKANIYGIIRKWHRLSWWIEKSNEEVNSRNLVITYLMFENKYSIDDLEKIFSGEKFASRKLSTKEIDLVKALEGNKFIHEDMNLRVKYECPLWVFALLEEDFGDNFENEMTALMSEAPMDIRVNTITASPSEVLEQLKAEGIDAQKSENVENAIRVFGRPQLLKHVFYSEGKIEFQDEGSQMVASFAKAKVGEQVLDYCAGAGGKTLAIGAQMENKGRIVATDISRPSLEKAKKRFTRAGLHNIETRILDNKNKWEKHNIEKFDLVLVDAPCTGTGTWRRAPEKHWRTLGPELKEILVTQKEILEKASKLVKKGGRLVYATCSILSQENEKQINNFLKTNKEFKIKDSFLKLTPYKNNTDGFFAAELEKSNG